MGKLIAKYRGFTPAAIKARADIPLQIDMVISGNNVDCSNISLNHVKNIIGAGNSNLYQLCRHDNVNVWSGFGPTIRSVNAQALVSSKPTIASLGDFAGYNHQAVTPGWLTGVPSGDIWLPSIGGTPQFDAAIRVGEVRWQELGIIGVVHAIYDGETLVAYQGIDFEDDLTQDDILDISITLPFTTVQKTYTGRIWLVNHLIDFTDSDIVCRLPNTADYSRQVRILPATTVVLDAPEGFTADVGFTNSPNLGTVYYSNLEGDATYDEVRVYASIWGYREGAMGSEILLNTFSPWHHDDFASGSGQPNGENFIYSDGYICTIRVEAVNY